MPQLSLNKAVETLFIKETCPWDLYCETMAHTDFMKGRHEQHSVKVYFYRKPPFGGSYALFGGLTEFLINVQNFTFQKAAASMSNRGYNPSFIKYLESRGSSPLNVTIHSLQEGSVIFPHEPVMIFSGPLLDIRFIEGLITVINRGSLFLTKWRRVVDAAFPNPVYEFSRRRAQNHLATSLYAQMAGVSGTSNAELYEHIDVSLVGTMGHELIKSIGNEFQAFDEYLEVNPNKPVLLVDTIDTLRSGVPHAIEAFKKHEESIKKVNSWHKCAIRNDSGDLAYLTIEEVRMLDERDLHNVGITQTNDLDEYSIASIKQQIMSTCGIQHGTYVINRTSWACGTKPGNAYDCPAFGGVAKLGLISNKPTMKLALDNPDKSSIPGDIRSKLVLDGNSIVACLIHLDDEDYKSNGVITKTSYQPFDVGYEKDDKTRYLMFTGKNYTFEERQSLVYDYNIDFVKDITLMEVRNHVAKSMEKLSWYHKRQLNPHEIKVCLSERLFALRFAMKDKKALIGDMGWCEF